jgi:ribosome-binding protein aMBF1 (putative translation factor)
MPRVKIPSGGRPRAAVEILHRRYAGDHPARKAALETARLHAEVARTIYDLRTQAGLSQQELAKLVGTTQSVISRLEDEDYRGHSLEMLHRIATALNKRMTVVVTGEEAKAGVR